MADVADRGYVLELGQVVYAGDVAGMRKQVEWPAGRPSWQRAVEVGPVSESLLSVRDVTSGYGSLMVLHGMTFDILPGEAVGIVGPNGAGKSTLLKTIAGALPTGRGSIALAGTAIERTSAARRVGHGIALVPEGRQVIRDLSVQGNLDVTLLGRRRRPATASTTTGSSRSTRCSRASPNGAGSRAARCPGASSRCWRSGGP